MVVFAIGVCTGLVSRRGTGRWLGGGAEGVRANSSLMDNLFVIVR